MKRFLSLVLPLMFAFAAPAFADDQPTPGHEVQQQSGHNGDEATPGEGSQSQAGEAQDESSAPAQSQSADEDNGADQGDTPEDSDPQA